jgi:dipeptidyl aminopeptidase/acylaminoacyl peptidase
VLCSTFTHMNAMTEHLKDTFNLPKHWFKNPHLTQPFDSISHVQNATAPTLVMHGTEDPEVPLLFAEQLYNEVNLPPSQKQLEVFEGEPHYIDPEQLMERTERFLQRQGVV